MKQYLKDYKDIITGKKCYNDFSCFYGYLLSLPETILISVAYIIIKYF